MKRNQFLVAILFIFSLCGTLNAQDAELRGTVTDSVSGKTLTGVTITLTPVSPGDAVADTTGIFGGYTLTGIVPGDYTLAASYPGYVPFSEIRTFAASDLDSRDISLIRVSPGIDLIDLSFVVDETSSGIPVKGVPIRVRRYALDDASVLEEAQIVVTGTDGTVELLSQLPGHYDFRFNNSADNVVDGSANPIFDAMTIVEKSKLEKSHLVRAQLTSTRAEVTITASGIDVAAPDDGVKALPDVILEIVGIDPEFVPPVDFDPLTDNPTDFTPLLFQRKMGTTGADGTFTFKDLPPLQYAVRAKRLGYDSAWTFFGPTGPAGSLPTTHTQPLAINPDTKLEVFLESSEYPDLKMIPGLAIEVLLEGLSGPVGENGELKTSSSGITRVAVATFDTSPEFPSGILRAEFTDIVPGNYSLTVDHEVMTPAFPAFESVVSPFLIHLRSEARIDIAFGRLNGALLELSPLPATVRGRFFKAEDRTEVDRISGREPPPFDRWAGPAYEPSEQPGIEFTESVLAPFLAPGASVVSVDTDPNGNFVAQILPGIYGIRIPGLDGYWGSNYRYFNRVSGEALNLGWPYATDPATIPAHPFGSFGIAINSGDDIGLDLYVRKQLYFLNGSVVADVDSPCLDQVAFLPASGPEILVGHSHLAVTGTYEFDENDAAPPAPISAPLNPGVTVSPLGVKTLNSGGAFLIKAGPGAHKVSVGDPHHVFPTGIFEVVTLPDYGFVGEGGPTEGIIPMENNWEQLSAAFGVIDPWIADYTGTHSLLITFKDAEDDEVRTDSNPDFVKHPLMGNKLFRIGTTPGYTMTAGTHTIWEKHDGSWYSATFTIPSIPGPATKEIEFLVGVGTVPPPTVEYELNLRAVNASNPSQTIPGITVTMTDGESIPLGASGDATLPSYTGTYLPTAISGTTKWLPAEGSISASFTDSLSFKADGSPVITTTILLKRGSIVRGTVEGLAKVGSETFTGPIGEGGLEVRILNAEGSQVLRSLVTDETGAFTTGDDPLEFSEVLFIETDARGYQDYRKRLTPTMGADAPGGPEYDFVVDIDLVPYEKPEIKLLEDTFGFRGMFLVGVSKGKSLDGFLTRYGDDTDRFMPYTVTVDKPFAEFISDVPPYDSKDGDDGSLEDILITDQIERIWIIDPRIYSGPPNVTMPVTMLSAEAGPFAIPSKTFSTGSDIGKPDPEFNEKMDAWISLIEGTSPAPDPTPRKYFWLSRPFVGLPDIIGPTGDETSRHKISEEIDIALLPPDLFNPLIVARTQNGAYNYTQWTVAAVEDPFLKHRELFGVQLPPSLSKFVVDAAGSILDYNLTGVSAPIPAPVFSERFFPSRAFKLDGGVDGDIEINPDKTLKYSYSYAAEISEGGDFPRNPGTLLSFGPQKLGGSVGGSLAVTANGSRFGVSGSDDNYGIPAISLIGSGSLGRNFGKLFPDASPINLEPKINLAASLQSTKPLAFAINGELKPLHVLYKSSFRIAGSIKATLDFSDLIPAVRAIKKVTENFGASPKIEAFMEPALSFRVSRKWKTRSPQELFEVPLVKTVTDKGGSVYTVAREDSVEANAPAGKRNSDPKPLARQLRALSAEVCPENPDGVGTELAVGLGFSGGLDVAIEGDIAEIGVSAEFFTENDDNPDVRFWDVTINPSFDEPFFSDLKGKLAFQAEARARAFFFEGRKRFDFGKLDVGRFFNTEPFFSLTPIEITETSIGISSAPRAVLVGLEPHLVDNAFPIARYAGAIATAGQAVLFLDPDSVSGTMRLQFALQSSAPAWAAAVEITNAPGLVGVALHSLPAGGWMAVWSEVAAGTLGALSPATSLMYSTSSDGIVWSAPAMIGTTAGTAFDLRLLPMPGGELGLVYLETERGPGANILDLEAFLYNGSTWGPQQVLFDDLFLTAFDAAGPGFTGTAEAQILGITDVGGLVAVGWDGVAVSPTVGLDGTVTGKEAAITSGPVDAFTAAALLPDGTLGVFRKVGAAAWVSPASVTPTGGAFDLDLAAVSDGILTRYVAAYSDADSTRDLGFLYFDESGAVLTGPTPIAPGSRGAYSAVQVLPVEGALAADILALYRDGDDVSEIRTFGTSVALGVLPVDRDADLMDDLNELLIVDFAPADGIARIDDVLPLDDFDLDTHTNKAEIDGSTDATDPDSFPGQSVSVTALIDTAREVDPAPAVFEITRTGNTAVALTVPFSVTGTATSGDDFDALLGSTLEIPVNASAVYLEIFPLTDDLAEGPETVTLTLTPDATYALGTPAATVTILDTPFDQFRVDHFTPLQLTDPSISGADGDAEGDGIKVILEYAFDGELFTSDPENLPLVGLVSDGVTDHQYLAIGYIRRKDDLELSYQVQISEGLTGWTDATDSEMVLHSRTDNGDGTETLFVRDRSPIADYPTKFLRIEVRRDPTEEG